MAGNPNRDLHDKVQHRTTFILICLSKHRFRFFNDRIDECPKAIADRNSDFVPMLEVNSWFSDESVIFV